MAGILLLGACAAPSGISVTAQELCSAYQDDEAAADEQYKDKILEVTGIVESVGRDREDNPYVVLTGGGMSEGVRCWFSARDIDQVLDLRITREATIRGKCHGYALFTVLVDGCSVVD